MKNKAEEQNAEKLCRDVEIHIHDLAMPDGKLQIVFTEKPDFTLEGKFNKEYPNFTNPTMIELFFVEIEESVKCKFEPLESENVKNAIESCPVEAISFVETDDNEKCENENCKCEDCKCEECDCDNCDDDCDCECCHCGENGENEKK